MKGASFVTKGKRSFFILSTETIGYELSNSIDQVGSGVTVASRSSVRCFDEFFSVPSFTCIILGSPSLQTDGLMTATAPPPPPPKSKPYDSSQRNSEEVGE